MTLIDKHTSDIQALCAKYKVNRLYAFGSAVTSQFGGNSDIDFIVDFQPQEINDYADNYFNLKFALEDTFKRQIDLLEEKAIKNPYFKQAIENHRLLIYGD
jgi:predicted nucleotidyltransferase